MTVSESWISMSEFARREGCSEGLVRRGVKRGHLVLSADKRLDPNLVGGGWRKVNRRLAASSRHAAPLPENDIDDDEPLIGVYAVKPAVLALKHLLASRALADDRADVEEICGPFVEGVLRASDTLLELSSQCGPSIAATLGVPIDRVVEALRIYIHQHLVKMAEMEKELTLD